MGVTKLQRSHTSLAIIFSLLIFVSSAKSAVDDLKDDLKGEINAAEKAFLLSHPLVAPALLEASCKAVSLSAATCELDLNDRRYAQRAGDEESDALRHFLFTSFLARSLGVEAAREFTTIHETTAYRKNLGRVNYSESSKMDLHNNAVALSWMSESFFRRYASDLQLLDIAIAHLNTGALITLRSGDTRCAIRPVIRPDWTELQKFHWHALTSRVGRHLCGTGLFLPAITN